MSGSQAQLHPIFRFEFHSTEYLRVAPLSRVECNVVMVGQEYASVPSTGKLKLKGVSDGRVEKKKKKKKLREDTDTDKPNTADPEKPNSSDEFVDNSVVLKQLEEEDAAITKESRREVSLVDGKQVEPGAGDKDEDVKRHLQTVAERRFEEQRRKRLEERLKKEGVKTHKQRVEELNRYLSSLSEHHDMPKIGPG